ncbi:UNVERIFIED_CONTAM: hypothetical protein HDU68_009942 [Siphonaria sp. JEL0065]|nr:hypothetical protein HDU68_009942 [Siphonaria sp. JEL0065]
MLLLSVQLKQLVPYVLGRRDGAISTQPATSGTIKVAADIPANAASSDGVSAGAIVGTSITATAGVVLIVAGSVFAYKRQKKAESIAEAKQFILAISA